MAHSKSPAMHNAAYRALGLDAVYLSAHVPPPALGTAVHGLWALGAVGVNLTVPHKREVMRACVELTPAARSIGAVNCLTRGAAGWVGENTDAGGWLDSWREEIGEPLQGRKAILLGAGGASQAVQYALHQAGARVLVLNRSPERGHGPLAQMAQELESGCVVVNCTTVGMAPAGDERPVAWPDNLPADCVACDLIYTPRPTRFLREAAERGARTLDGLGMLLHQAARAIRLWTGQDPPLAVMRSALLDS